MFTNKDIQYKTILVLNCAEGKTLRVGNGELVLEEKVESKAKIITKFPFQKILAVFVIGNMSITTPLIDKCRRFGVALIVTKFSLRPIFVWANYAESNYVLHQRQYDMKKEDISIAKILVKNKIRNQIKSLKDTRRGDEITKQAISECSNAITRLSDLDDSAKLLGIEGSCAKTFFSAYFQNYDWQGRQPRMKRDFINVILDIGYTILFNYVECFLCMFGFDLYVGVYHRLWFKRKSLVCDIVEPFRCIIDKTARTCLNKKQFKKTDFEIYNSEYQLKREKAKEYYKIFFDALIPYKKDVFSYVQNYYRCFMESKETDKYPMFLI